MVIKKVFFVFSCDDSNLGQIHVAFSDCLCVDIYRSSHFYLEVPGLLVFAYANDGEIYT